MIVPLGTTVIITPQTKSARTGDRTAGTPRTVPDCAVWPNTTTELVQGQDTVTWDLTALLPPGTVVSPTDTITVDGVIYEVHGKPSPLRSSFTGWQPGVEVQLRTQTG